MVFPFPVQHPPVPTTTIGGSVRPTRTTATISSKSTRTVTPATTTMRIIATPLSPIPLTKKLTSDRPVAQWVKASRRGRGYGRMRGPSKNGLRVK